MNNETKSAPQKRKVRKPYQMLQKALAELIAETTPGERLPAEPGLAQSLGVSRATLREAMRSFEEQGVIRRKQGVGTFVVSHSHAIDGGLEVLESIESLANKIGLKVSMGDVNIERVPSNEEISQTLNIEPGSPILNISRVIHAKERPAAYLIDILPEDILSKEEIENEFSGSVLDYLLKRGTPQLANSLTEIRAVTANSEIARALEIQRGDALLSFVARLLTTEGRTIDYSISYFLPGYFRFNILRKVGSIQDLTI